MKKYDVTRKPYFDINFRNGKSLGSEIPTLAAALGLLCMTKELTAFRGEQPQDIVSVEKLVYVRGQRYPLVWKTYTTENIT